MPLVIATVLVLGSAPAALAHATSATVRNSYGQALGHGGVHSSHGLAHRHAYVCDDRVDNLAVYIDYFTQNGGPFRMYDPNGSGGGCGNRDEAVEITVYKICMAIPAAPDNCTRLKNT